MNISSSAVFSVTIQGLNSLLDFFILICKIDKLVTDLTKIKQKKKKKLGLSVLTSITHQTGLVAEAINCQKKRKTKQFPQNCFK